GGAVEPIGQGMADAVAVGELRFRHRVVDVDRRERQSALFGQAVEAGGTGGGLLAHALDSGGEAGEASRGRLDRRGDLGQQDLVLLRVVLGGGGHSPGGFALGALEHVQGGVTAVVENEVRPVGEVEDPIGGPPV